MRTRRRLPRDNSGILRLMSRTLVFDARFAIREDCIEPVIWVSKSVASSAAV